MLAAVAAAARHAFCSGHCTCCMSRCSTTELLDTLRVKMGNVLKDRHAQNSFQTATSSAQVLHWEISFIF